MTRKKLSMFTDLNKIITQIPVSQIMVTGVKTVKPEDSVHEVIDIMAKYSISGLIVTDDKSYPIGIISEGDIIKKVLHANKNMNKVKVKDIMSSHLLTIRPSLSMGEASVLMKKHNISKLPVVDNDKLIGYVTKSDLVEKLNEIYYQNARLKWLPIVVMIEFIIIAILLVSYIYK